MTQNESDPTLGDDPARLLLSGALADQLFVLSNSQMTLMTTFAETGDGRRVLFPLRDWQMLGHPATESPDPEPVLSRIVPLDNIAFLLRDRG